jgi:16S rRNA (guanine966-N2)-methyltransferase
MDRLRQGVFSSLGESVVGSRFFDLFACTGSYGLEAFSRGASCGIFVERDRRSVEVIKANIAAVCKSLRVTGADLRTSSSDVMQWCPPESGLADLVFVDPPFADIPALAPALFERVRGFVNPGGPGILVFQMPGKTELEAPGWRFLRRIGKGRDQPTCCLYQPE